MIRYDTFSMITGGLVIVGAIAMFVVVMRMNRAWKTMDTDNYDRELVLRRARQLNVGGGLFQITLGLFLISLGNAVSIGLIGMGVILVVAGHYGLLTGEWQERHRPGRD